MPHIDIVFDGPPAAESGRFVETEDHTGRSMRFGQWVETGDNAGPWALRIHDGTEHFVEFNAQGGITVRTWTEYGLKHVSFTKDTRLAREFRDLLGEALTYLDPEKED